MRKTIIVSLLISFFAPTHCMDITDRLTNEPEKKQIDVIRSTAIAIRKRSSGELIKKKTIDQLEHAAAQKAEAHNQKILAQVDQQIKK